MKAIVVTDEAARTAGMTLVERPEPPASIKDVVVQAHASGFVPTEMAWPVDAGAVLEDGNGLGPGRAGVPWHDGTAPRNTRQNLSLREPPSTLLCRNLCQASKDTYRGNCLIWTFIRPGMI
jgi:hypothetical protein